MIHPKEAKELLYRMFEDHYVSLTVRCHWIFATFVSTLHVQHSNAVC